MGAPWTRDGTVRVYVVTMAPEVAGRIIKLPIADNQFVRKGDVLFEIDPEPFKITPQSAQAQMQRDNASLEYARENERAAVNPSGRRLGLEEHLSTGDKRGAPAGGSRCGRQGNDRKGEYDLSRVVVHSPVTGYVTNLLARVGDYANGPTHNLARRRRFLRVDGYFEETNLRKNPRRRSGNRQADGL